MAKLFDLVKVNTATTGTGTITFGSVFSPEFFTPSEVGAVDGDVVRYVLIDGTDIELGSGTIGGSVTTMTRTVNQSRIGGVAGTSAINLSGTAYLAFTASKNDIVTSLNGGAGALSLSVVTQVFTSSGTYTPTSGMVYAIIECVGGGGAGGGSSGLASNYYAGGGGGAGGYSRKRVTAADIGASKTVTIGAAGTGSSNAAGGAGGDTSVGVLCIGKGGSGGTQGNTSTVPAGGAGGVAGTGDVAAAGMGGNTGVYGLTANTLLASGYGGNSYFGGGASGKLAANATSTAGGAAGAYGSGGSGASSNNVATSAAGGNGSAGVVVITEFVVS